MRYGYPCRILGIVAYDFSGRLLNENLNRYLFVIACMNMVPFFHFLRLIYFTHKHIQTLTNS